MTQSIGQIFFAMNVQLPPIPAWVRDAANIFNLNISRFFKFDCNFNFIDNLYFLYIMQLCIFLLFFVGISVTYYLSGKHTVIYDPSSRPGSSCCCCSSSSSSFNRRGDGLGGFGLHYRILIGYLLSYLAFVIPLVSTNIAKLFDCVNVDPLRESGIDAKYTFYLRSDLSINCTDPDYLGAWRTSLIMLLFFPFGSTFFIVYYLKSNEVLIQNKKAFDYFAKNVFLNKRKQFLKISNKSDGIFETVKHFTEPYHPQYWYWEIVDIFKRLILSAGIAIIYPGQASQVVITIVIALLFLQLYDKSKPFVSKSDQEMTSAGDWMLIVTIFYTYILKTKGLVAGSSSSTAMMYSSFDYIFAATSALFAVTNVYLIVRDYYEENKEGVSARSKGDAKEALKKKFLSTQMVTFYLGENLSLNNLQHLSYFRKRLERGIDSSSIARISFVLSNRLMKTKKEMKQIDLNANNSNKLISRSISNFFYSAEESSTMQLNNLLSSHIKARCIFPITKKIAGTFQFISKRFVFPSGFPNPHFEDDYTFVTYDFDSKLNRDLLSNFLLRKRNTFLHETQRMDQEGFKVDELFAGYNHNHVTDIITKSRKSFIDNVIVADESNRVENRNGPVEGDKGGGGVREEAEEEEVNYDIFSDCSSSDSNANISVKQNNNNTPSPSNHKLVTSSIIELEEDEDDDNYSDDALSDVISLDKYGSINSGSYGGDNDFLVDMSLILEPKVDSPFPHKSNIFDQYNAYSESDSDSNKEDSSNDDFNFIGNNHHNHSEKEGEDGTRNNNSNESNHVVRDELDIEQDKFEMMKSDKKKFTKLMDKFKNRIEIIGSAIDLELSSSNDGGNGSDDY